MTDTMKHSASDLQLQLARQIAENIISGGLQSGQHLRETELSATLNVSRSPVRAALGLLFSEGLVDKEANRGFFVRAAHDDFLAFLDRLPKTDDEIIKEAIARDWFEGAVPKEGASAAALSPPPTTVNAFVSAIACATVRVPASKRGSSNMPIGPFQNTVRASMITSLNAAAVPGPMSKPLAPSGRRMPKVAYSPLASTPVRSSGRWMVLPLALDCSSRRLHVST